MVDGGDGVVVEVEGVKAEYAAQTLQGKKRLDLRHENKKLFYLYLYERQESGLVNRVLNVFRSGAALHPTHSLTT